MILTNCYGFSRSWSGASVWLLAVMFVPHVPAFGSGGDENDLTVQTVLDHLKKSEERFDTVVIEWQDTIVSPRDEALERAARDLGLKPLAADLSYVATAEVKMSGNKWRMETKSKQIIDGTLSDMAQTSVFKNGLLRTFMPIGTADQPLGNLTNDRFAIFPRNLRLQPPFKIFRPLVTNVLDASKYTVGRKRVLVKELSCVVAEGRPEGRSLSAIYLSPQRDWSIVRWTISENGSVLSKCDIDYEMDEEKRWVPQKWTIVESNGADQLGQSISSVVRRCKIGGSMDEQVFDFEFPPGTLVRDFTTPDSKKKLTQYIAREAGQKRIITAEEKGATFEELLETESGQAGRKRIVPYSFPFVEISAALLVVAIVMLLYGKVKSGKWVR